jgi:hypothetical protein
MWCSQHTSRLSETPSAWPFGEQSLSLILQHWWHLSTVGLRGGSVRTLQCYTCRSSLRANTYRPGDRFSYIQPLYRSVLRLGMRLVVFHDGEPG